MSSSTLKDLLSVCINPTVIIDREFNVVELNREAAQLKFERGSSILPLMSMKGDITRALSQCFKSTNKRRFCVSLISDVETDVLGWRLVGQFRTDNFVMLQLLDIAKARSHFIVSSIKKIEQKARKAEQEAKEANAAKSQFLANMSHEIRTPLNGIFGLLEIIQDTDLNATQRNYIRKASSSAKLLQKILNDILDISKIEANQLAIESIPFNLEEQLIALREIFIDQANARQIDFKIKYKEDCKLTLYGDPTRLTQVLMNLCSNAIKFTSTGSVCLSVDASITDKQAHLQFIVKDTGIGIEEASLSSIFDKFTQADSGIARLYGGTGLGLAIAKNLVEAMQGEISIKSVVGVGSEVSVNIPFAIIEHKETTSAQTLPKPCSIKQTLKILLVDDNDINLEIAKVMLEQENHFVVVTRNGEMALSCINKHTFDLVFLDIQMPIMDGITTIKKIREDSQWDALPVIALTANVRAEDVNKYLKIGFNGHVGKPFSKQMLLSAIDDVFYKKAANFLTSSS